ncbi:DUF2812 domain-containing protein ['Paenibacillus yunnanensis' Narsing Rao et al. 2020]|uniref:DUF2812 domain-containing protein n=1 Tax=Paenibacillus tengchongensis TaxID=2608684 RepID=UPI00124C5E53|nr:DUF2812 domain-containing protein [Paenibacillus tengchongensis]
MAKYRMSNGWAISPGKDMLLLKRMSRQGWHVTGMKGMLYSFEQGGPHDYDYALNMEERVTPEMMALFEASGWTPVVAFDGLQIFRAEAGASPIFSDSESEAELLSKNRQQYGKWSLVPFCLAIICFILKNQVEEAERLFFCLGLFMLVCFVFTFFPFIGLSLSLRKKRSQQG